jgi:hypothetical protein
VNARLNRWDWGKMMPDSGRLHAWVDVAKYHFQALGQNVGKAWGGFID